MAAKFKNPGADTPTPAASGIFIRGPGLSKYGYVPTRPGRREGLGVTPALVGLFRAGRTVGVSQINAMATVVWRGP